MEKICTICKTSKNKTEFNKNKSRKDGYNTICRICSNERSKLYYQENKEHHKKVIRERTNKVILENRQKLFEYYSNNSCVDCGNDNPIVLELYHRDDVIKINEISNMVHSGYSWEIIEKEINKCDVRCSNCHKIRTSKTQGWYKGLII